VHEILSREPSDQVPFDEIVTSLIRMAKDSVVSRHLTFEVTGGLGEVPADVATPLAVVLAELVQNAIEHAFLDFEADGEGDGAAPVTDADDRDHTGTIRVDLQAEGGLLRVEVLDDGSGLPDGFDIDESQSLGLSIVRDLVRTQLDGTITMRNRAADGSGVTGTLVAIELPAQEPQPIGQ